MSKSPVYDQILDVAETLIQTQGYNAFSFRDIANSIGIKTSSIHYYFPTKTELGIAVVMRYINALQIDLMQLQQARMSYKKKLQLFMTGIVEKTYATDRRMCLGGMLASDILTLPLLLQQEVRSFFQRIEKWLEQLLQQGRASGEFQFNGSAKKEAEFILALLEGALLLARLFQSEDKLTMAQKQIEKRLF